jgi:uncharacterized membrane protein
LWRVTNKSQDEAWVAILYYNPGCRNEDGSIYAKKGWWHLNPGETKTVLGGSMRQEASYYIQAHKLNGSTWGNKDTVESCPNERFDWCSRTSSNTSREYGFSEVYSRTSDHTTSLL